ncbi:MAG: hypothetical protein LBN09_02185 [Clostridioides sp.]|jgi:hypothetical protein|nr:hypothetical protein [Clostridioides sp.]
MKRIIGLMTVSVGILLVSLNCLYFNEIRLDMKNLDAYVLETNIILESIEKEKIPSEEEKILSQDKKLKYVGRLVKIQDGLENTNTSFLTKAYRDYKIKSIKNLIDAVTYDDSECYREVARYNRLGDLEIEKLSKNNFITGTFSPINHILNQRD